MLSRSSFILRLDAFAHCQCRLQQRRSVLLSLHLPRRWITAAQEVENINVSHARFIAEAPTNAKWRDTADEVGKGGTEGTADDFDTISKGKGKLSPTSSHLFKLILPLEHLHRSSSSMKIKPPPPTVFLLHPSQPLSHVARLILASLAPATPTVSFRSMTPHGHTFQWADSTDVGDFIRDAARATEFEIRITDEDDDTTIQVEVPSLADRTRFLRWRLRFVQEELKKMEGLKRACDSEANRGAKRMALGGLGALVVYWGTVARLTFWDLGWNVMEPVTYLSGLTMVIIGYLWFLYQGREVSYSSVLQRSVSARREALYKARGLDIEHWLDLMSEEKTLRREISKIAEDYDERLWHERQESRQEHDRERQAQKADGAKEETVLKGVSEEASPVMRSDEGNEKEKKT